MKDKRIIEAEALISLSYILLICSQLIIQSSHLYTTKNLRKS